jgi:hypothetical protein
MFPIIPASTSGPSGNEGIFGFGWAGGPNTAVTNLVSNIGVVSADVAGVPAANTSMAGCEYGSDTGIFGFGGGPISSTNLVSNLGVVATDTAGVAGATPRYALAACSYGSDKGIFGFGYAISPARYTAISNLVSNSGVVAADQAAATGSVRYILKACEYGGDKGIFGFGHPSPTAVTNLVSNTGVVATDTAGVGTARRACGACNYSGDRDKGIFGYGIGPGLLNMTSLVSNLGVVSSDVTGVGTAKSALMACEYGDDKGIFGYGSDASSVVNATNLVSNTGVVSTDVTGVGTARDNGAACSFA